MKKTTISIVLIIIAVGLSIASWLLLPEIVAIQVGMNNQVTNTAPKLLAIIIPLAITFVGSYISKQNDANPKGLILAIAGIVIMIITLFFNL